MSVSYNKLWKLCIDNNMKKMDLCRATKMSNRTLAKLSHNANVSLEVLLRICQVFHCSLDDIVEVVHDDLGGYYGE